jgi:hypothetical protein
MEERASSCVLRLSEHGYMKGRPPSYDRLPVYVATNPHHAPAGVVSTRSILRGSGELVQDAISCIGKRTGLPEDKVLLLLARAYGCTIEQILRWRREGIIDGAARARWLDAVEALERDLWGPEQ